jgi:protein-S-isoprenylcysteine O-methyltransferase Ste14
MKKPRLVSDWRRAWRWFSVQAFVILGAVGPVWAMIPEDWRAAVPSAWLGWGAAVLAVLGIAGRVIAQDKPAEGADS